MGKFIDLTGLQYGRLGVIGFAGRDKHRNALWKCVCSCSCSIVVVRADNLRAGQTESCGCLKKEQTAQMGRSTAKNLIGRRFGNLTVRKKLEQRRGGHVVWECICDSPEQPCGRLHEATGFRLINGTTIQCKRCRIRQVSKKLSTGSGVINNARRDFALNHILTQREVALILGCHNTTISRAELAGRKFRLKHLQKKYDTLFGERDTTGVLSPSQLSPEVVAEFAQRPKIKRRRKRDVVTIDDVKKLTG